MVLSNHVNTNDDSLQETNEPLCFTGTPAGDFLIHFVPIDAYKVAYALTEIYLHLENPGKFFGAMFEFEIERLIIDFVESLEQIGLPKASLTHWLEEDKSDKTKAQKIFHEKILALAIREVK